MKIFTGVVVGGALLFAGCTTYEHGSVKDGVISNPTVGWNGYSVSIPDGMARLQASADDGVPDRETEFRAWYEESNVRFPFDYDLVYYEQFVLENEQGSFVLSFVSDTYDFTWQKQSPYNRDSDWTPELSLEGGGSWDSTTSVYKEFLANRMVKRKKVILNDTKAQSERVEMGACEGWYISGVTKPYFQKDASKLAYEGMFIFGGLKEVFWIEAFGDESARAEMKDKVFEMAESLEVL